MPLPPTLQVTMAVFGVGVSHIFRLVFQGWLHAGMATVCFQLLSIDGSREQLLHGDKERNARCSHSTFYRCRVQREVDRTSQNSLNRRCSYVLWFQWLNHRSAPTEPCVCHPLPLSATQTGPAMIWTKPIPHILIKLAVAVLVTPPLAKRGDKKDLLQMSGRPSLFLSPFPLIIIKFIRVLEPSSRHPGGGFSHINVTF